VSAEPNRTAERLDYEDELYKAGWSDPAWEDPTHPAWAMKLRAERAEAEVMTLREELRRIADDPARALSLRERGVVP
jgi:hypothetical protein